jgi:Predicted membrane protein (DUF2231)
MLVPIPIACFIGALVTDNTYAVTAEMMWSDFSAWLILVGLIGGILAAIAGLTDFLGNRGIRNQTTAWLHLIGNVVVLVLSFFNLLVHTRDAWTSVVPIGLFDHRCPDPASDRLVGLGARPTAMFRPRKRSGGRYEETIEEEPSNCNSGAWTTARNGTIKAVIDRDHFELFFAASWLFVPAPNLGK